MIEPTENTAPPLRLLDVGHVGADQLLQRLAGNGGVEAKPLLVHDDEVLAVVAFGGGEHDGVERAAQAMVEPVELEAGRAAAREAVAAEQLVLHALEDPGVVVVARRRRLAIGVADEAALAREADAAEQLGGRSERRHSPP